VKEISGNTKVAISLATVATIVVGAGTAVWKTSQILTDIRDSVRAVSSRIENLESSTTDKLKSLELVMADRFTKTQAAEWALRIKVANPAMNVPDPREPSFMLGHP
jgi:hypothetical protein